MRRSWSCPPGQGAAMPGRRGGIRLRFDPGVDPEVRRALMQFVRWLQTQYAFPVRVPVYVRAAERLLCRDGDLACGTFLGPSDPEQEPYIRLAVGDYLQLLAAWGQDSALASILRSLAHELTHADALFSMGARSRGVSDCGRVQTGAAGGSLRP